MIVSDGGQQSACRSWWNARCVATSFIQKLPAVRSCVKVQWACHRLLTVELWQMCHGRAMSIYTCVHTCFWMTLSKQVMTIANGKNTLKQPQGGSNDPVYMSSNHQCAAWTAEQLMSTRPPKAGVLWPELSKRWRDWRRYTTPYDTSPPSIGVWVGAAWTLINWRTLLWWPYWESTRVAVASRVGSL